MKLESEHNEKEQLGRESSVQCYEGEKRQSEGKGAYKTEGTYPRHLL